MSGGRAYWGVWGACVIALSVTLFANGTVEAACASMAFVDVAVSAGDTASSSPPDTARGIPDTTMVPASDTARAG